MQTVSSLSSSPPYSNVTSARFSVQKKFINHHILDAADGRSRRRLSFPPQKQTKIRNCPKKEQPGARSEFRKPAKLVCAMNAAKQASVKNRWGGRFGGPPNLSVARSRVFTCVHVRRKKRECCVSSKPFFPEKNILCKNSCSTVTVKAQI